MSSQIRLTVNVVKGGNIDCSRIVLVKEVADVIDVLFDGHVPAGHWWLSG